jgi:uncharacterized protein
MMPLPPLKPSAIQLFISLAALTSFGLIRELVKDGVRAALIKIWKGAWIFIHPRTCFAVVKVLTPAETRPLVRAEPRLLFKYLTGYLGADLSRSERASILVDHYAFLTARVQRNFFRMIVDRRVELWRQIIGEHVYRICLTFPRTATEHYEGDLSLIFEADGVGIYVLSFAIGPGSIAGLAALRAIYIARVQGKGKGLHLIRTATKMCEDISPQALLLAAAEGVATALGLSHIVGIGADNHISANADLRSNHMVNAYDEFWLAAGGLRLKRNMYHLPVPLPHKPIQSIKRNHRSRALRKREYKIIVKEQVCRAFRDVALVAPKLAVDRLSPQSG